MDTKIELNIKICRFQSWLTKLVRILLVLYSKVYWHSATSYREFQSLININMYYRVITGDRYLLESEKERKRLRYKVGNPKLPDLQCFEVSKRIFFFVIRELNKVCKVLWI